MRRWSGWALGGAVALGAAWVLSGVLPPAYDFFGVYHPAIRAVWAGSFSYAAHPGYLNPPWALVLLLPLGLLPVALARAVLVVATLAAVAWALRGTRRYVAVVALTVASVPMLALIWLGQIEVFAIVGTALGWRAVRRGWWPGLAAALLLVSIKPQETWIVAAWLLIVAARRLEARAWLKVGLVVGGVVVISSGLLGWEWVNRVVGGAERYSVEWQNFSLWQLSEVWPTSAVIGSIAVVALAGAWGLRRAGASAVGLGLAVALSNSLSPYVTAPHLVMALTFGWSVLADRAGRWAVVVYGLTLTPLLRVVSGDQGLNRWDVAFPIGVVAGLLWVVVRMRRD